MGNSAAMIEEHYSKLTATMAAEKDKMTRANMNQATQSTFNELKKARKSYVAQSGEDGLLEYILSKLPNQNHWCVEFGAWDGKHLSNTYYFISQKNYKAVLIEAEQDRHAQLCVNMKKYNAICLNAMVAFTGEHTLDKLLSSTPIPEDFDLLSVDIDGDDYFVWQALEDYGPKVVIIEINIRDKPTVDRINIHGAPFVLGITGTSIKSMTELAERKGYRLIAHIGCNAIYVRKDLYEHFYTEKVKPEDVFTYEGHSLSELTKVELITAKYWGYTQKGRLLSRLVPRPLQPLARKIYRSVIKPT
jgi:hypothetical protein